MQPMCAPRSRFSGLALVLTAVLALGRAGDSGAAEAAVVYGWHFYSGDGRIDQQQADTTVAVPRLLLDRPQPVTRSDALNLTGPAQTSADIALTGRVDLLARSLGVQVSAHAKVNPFDPDDHTLRPLLVSTNASVQTGFHDRVLVFDPTVLPGAPVSFTIQPLRTSGRMDVTPLDPAGQGGAGVANLLIGFAMESVLPGGGAPTVLSFEQFISSGTPAESTWNASALGGVAALAGGPLTVPNGSVWDVSFVVRAAVQAVPGLFPAANPKGALSEAQFLNTVHWGGIADAVDGQGRALTQLSLQGELGFDWVSPVPEPATWGLMAIGLLALAGRRHRCMGRPSAPAGFLGG